jgi:hypothetical protein
VFGYSLGLGCLPVDFVPSEKVLNIVETLMVCAKIPSDVSMRDAETRRNSLVAIREILGSFGVKMFPYMIDRLFETLLVALDDYSADNRDEIGSWVRESAVRQDAGPASFAVANLMKRSTRLTLDASVSSKMSTLLNWRSASTEAN